METPSNTLFVANIPFGLDEQEFVDLFAKHNGFVEARLRKDRNDNFVGFADFQDATSASRARDGINGYKFSHTDSGLSIHFAHSSGASTSRPKRTKDDSERKRGPRAPGASLSVGIPDMSSPFFPNFSSPLSNFGAMGGGVLPPEATSTLYVEGLPLDVTDREVSHIFRPYGGFQSVRTSIKDSKQFPNKQYVLCFVEFDNKYQATLAMHSLQGYRMDKNDTKGLNITYAKSERKENRKEKSILISPQQTQQQTPQQPTGRF